MSAYRNLMEVKETRSVNNVISDTSTVMLIAKENGTLVTMHQISKSEVGLSTATGIVSTQHK